MGERGQPTLVVPWMPWIVNCMYTVIISRQSSKSYEKLKFCLFSVMIICDHVEWLLTGNRKQKNIMSNFWPKNWSQSLKKFE